jgi:hypothetical protein
MGAGIGRFGYDLFRIETKPRRFQVTGVANHHVEQDDPGFFASHPVNLALKRAPAMIAYEHVHASDFSKECATPDDLWINLNPA